MVLSDWKKSLWDSRPDWGRGIHSDEWWALVNYVIDRITLPSSRVFMACHPSEPVVPLGWIAVREDFCLASHSRKSVNDEPELAAHLERSLWEHALPSSVFGIGRRAHFNPFTELKR